MEKEKEKPKRSVPRKIFNGIIGLFIGLIILFVLLVGFSQTYTFRNFLRKEIISAFNKTSGGKLNIRKIDGTLLTTLTVHDLSITVDNDTLISARKSNLFLSPLHIFLNKVFVREFETEGLKVALLQDSAGVWNLSKLSKDQDTTSSESFIESFQVNSIKIKDLHLIRKTYPHLGTSVNYNIVNFDDLDIQRINISGSAIGDIKNKDYFLKLDNFSLEPNLEKFTIKRISGEFALNTKSASVKNFRIETDSTDISLSARLDSINIFKGIELQNFKNYPAQLQMDVNSFWFDDLSSFIDATGILKGRPSLKLVADGKFGSINIRQLRLKYLDTQFEIKGSLKNLNSPSQMFIDASIQKAYVDYGDVLSLLPTLKLPLFEGLILKNLDVTFKGEPTKFNSELKADSDGGKITAKAFLNVKPKQMEYDARIETVNLNFKPVTGFDTEINSVSTIKGKGVNPEDLESQFVSQILNSKVGNNVVHDFKISANGKAGNIIVDFNTAINNLKGTISGNFDFTKEGAPKYNFAGRFNALNLYQFTADSTLDSRLNFGIFAQGENFDLDSLKSDITVNLDASSFNNKTIPTSQLRLLVDTQDENNTITLFSPFADLNFSGNFSLKKAIELVDYESSTIGNIISQKLDELNPLAIVQDSEISISEETKIPDIVNYPLNIKYDFVFKDIKPFSDLLKASRLDLNGRGSGTITNEASNFSISAKLLVDNFVMLNGKSNPIYISDLTADLKFSRNNNTLSFENLFGSVSLSADRFYISNDFRDLNADLTFNESKLYYNTSSKIDSLWYAELEGSASFSARMQEIRVERAYFENQGIEWASSAPFYLSFAADHFQVNGLLIKNRNSSIAIDGQIFNVGYINGDIVLHDIKIEEIEKMFPKLGNSFNGNFNLTARIDGKMSQPVISTDIKIINFGIKNKRSGDLLCKLNYTGETITTDLKIADSLNSANTPLLSLTGYIPVNLAFTEVEKRIAEDREINLLLNSKRFDAAAFGDLLPLVINQEGNIESDLKINGTLNNLLYNGFMRIKQGRATGRLNNMTYDCGLKVNFNGSDIRVDSLIVKNTPDSRYIGTMTGKGSVVLTGIDITKMNITMNGDLAVYSEKSRIVTPAFFGDLFVESAGDLRFDLDNGKSLFQGKIILKETSLTYTAGQELSGSEGTNNIKITYLTDKKANAGKDDEFRRIIASQNEKKKNTAAAAGTFDYNITVETRNDASIVFIFTNLANQKLTVFAQTNNLSFRSDTGPLGRLVLQPGSNLDFYKIFKAEGSVFFENDIANPNLNVTATYSNESIAAPEGQEKTRYEVEMKLNGPLDQLAVNLAKEKGKFKIYKLGGINARQELARKDPQDIDNDAISFILTGKLKDELTQGEKTSLASTLSNSVATSLVGSFLTGFLNSALGDVVTDVKLGPEIFSLSGAIKGFSYEVGGSTQALQDLRYMNLKLEIPLLSNFRLRTERKDPVLKTTLLENKIYEVGLKLRFIF